MRLIGFLAPALIAIAGPSAAQNPYDPAVRIPAQREAMARLSFLDGTWRGPAWSVTPEGRQELVQTERAGAFLDGSVKVIEGRAYRADGSIGFNALAVISYDPTSRSYSINSHALGFSATFPLQVAANGFSWERPAGPNATIRYTTRIENGTWHEIGEHIAAGRAPARVFEMTLTRVGDSDWPAAGAVPRN